MQNDKRPSKRAVRPMDAIQLALDDMIEASYEDSEVTPEELSTAHRRFENAINYLASCVCETMLADVLEENHALRARVTDLELSFQRILNEKK